MVDEVTAELAARGYATLPDVLAPDQVAAARKDLEGILESTPPGRDDFEGRRTVLSVLDRVLEHYQLSAPAGICIGPGERAQPLHRDDAIYPVPRPHPELVVNVMWPLDDFTEANGATRVVPGSHRRESDQPPEDASVETIEMPAGSALLYLGSTWHGGGPNRTERSRLGVVLHYAVSWLRPVENHVLAVPPRIAETLPKRLQELLGYNICPPFIGYVDGRHPSKLLA